MRPIYENSNFLLKSHGNCSRRSGMQRATHAAIKALEEKP
ncbi:hypothetical protein D558_2171 [Bordetella holmesii 44057]|nr:hypothetical protein D558_2171 [Bordetella holmesii 44057]